MSVPCCIWLFFSGSIGGAIALAVWSLLVAIGIDNVLKSMILHGQSKLHPLVERVGGRPGVGPAGNLYFGPMAVAFLQSGLAMLNTRELQIQPDDGKPSAAEMSRS